MANFNTHLTIASIVSGAVVSMAYKAGVVGFKEMFYAWFLGVIGGILPDIDSDNSAAVRLIFSLLGIFSIACVLRCTVAFFIRRLQL